MTGLTNIGLPTGTTETINLEIEKLSTRTLVAQGFGRATLDRVGFLDAENPNVLANLNVSAETIELGVIRAAFADFKALKGNIDKATDIDVNGSNAGTGFEIKDPGDATTTAVAPSGLRKTDPNKNDPLINVTQELKLTAPGTIDPNTGQVVAGTGQVNVKNGAIDQGNFIEKIIVDDDIQSLDVETANELVINRANDAKVGEVSVKSERGVTLDLEVEGDLDIFGGFAPDNTTVINNDANVTINGTVSGNATATATNDATIDGIVGKTATAEAKRGTASIGGTVGGDAIANAGGTGIIDAGVGGNATIDAGVDGKLAGTVGGNATVNAESGILLAEARALAITGSLTANSDDDGSPTSASSITQNEAVSVQSGTTLVANNLSDIMLTNAANDFVGDVDIKSLDPNQPNKVVARQIDIRDASNLTIASLGDIAGRADDVPEVNLIAGNSLTLKDEDTSVRNGDTVDDYLISAGETWNLEATGGDINLVGSIATESSTSAGSLTLNAPNGAIRFQDFVGLGSNRDRPITSDRPLGTVTIKGARDVVFGLNKTIDDPGNPEAMFADDDFVSPAGRNEDIFFANELLFESASGDLLLLMPQIDEATADFINQYFGLNLTDRLDYTPASPSRIELFGRIGNTRTQAAGLSPRGDRDPNYQFNNCIIGDPNNCSAITQAGVLQLVDPKPAEVFRLDTDQVEQLFLSFGNEELWGLPSVFTTDLDAAVDEDDEEEDVQ